MNNYLRKLMVLAFLALALTGAALAQMDTQLVRVSIPFSFYADGKLLPAGEYTLTVNEKYHAVTLAENATGSRSIVLGSPDDALRGDHIVLTFKLVADDVYALREVQGPDLGVSFNTKTPQGTMRAQNGSNESVTVIGSK
jgi:hypothetical protein